MDPHKGERERLEQAEEVDAEWLVRSYVGRSMKARRRIDRLYGLRATADVVLEQLDADQRSLLRLAARHISATHSLEKSDRDAAIRFLFAKRSAATARGSRTLMAPGSPLSTWVAPSAPPTAPRPRIPSITNGPRRRLVPHGRPRPSVSHRSWRRRRWARPRRPLTTGSPLSIPADALSQSS